MRYLALLRGINVSGQKIIKMEHLRALMADAGYKNVKTYIQSGNIVFSSNEKSKQKAAKSIENLIKKHYGFDVSVLILDAPVIDKIIADNPYTKGTEPEPAGIKKIYVTFLSDVPLPENAEKLLEAAIGEDAITLAGDVVYFKLANGAADSKLSNNFIESRLKVKATTRNWNTTLRLATLIKD